MKFEWDEAKRAANRVKHGLDFADAALLFDGPLAVGHATTIEGEQRMLAIGRIGAVYVTTVYTVRSGAIRIISMRRARSGERRQHQALHGL